MLAALFYVVVFIAAAPDELIAFGEIPRSSAGDVIAGEGAALCNVGHAPFQGSIARRRRSLRRRFLQVAYECCRAKRSNGKLRICKLPSTALSHQMSFVPTFPWGRLVLAAGL